MATGIPPGRVRRDYGLHSCNPDEMHRQFDEARFIRIPPATAEDGDFLVVRPSPTTLHIVILTGRGYLHADARQRKVVEAPGELPWPVLSAWRHPADAAEDPLAPELVGPSEGLH